MHLYASSFSVITVRAQPAKEACISKHEEWSEREKMRNADVGHVDQVGFALKVYV